MSAPIAMVGVMPGILDNPVSANPVLQMDPLYSGVGILGGGGFVAPHANSNQQLTPQQQYTTGLPASSQPLSLFERNWQNYGSRMTADDVMASEPVWGTAQLYADQGLGHAEGFAAAANDMWQRMGANRYITPEMARRYVATELAKMRGIKAVPDADR